MKIRIKSTVKLLPYGKEATFHKGKVYPAQIAYNQPGWVLKQKVFAQKKNGHSILLQKGEYEVINGTFAGQVQADSAKFGILKD